MNLLFLEPFFGGSHRTVAEGYARHSRHRVTILSLPPRFWKWRMRGASLAFIRRIKDLAAFDLVFATDMMDLTDFKALAGPACPPIVLYFHENQLSYPLAPGEKRDFHLGFTNMVSALAADLVLFNSRFHQDEFLRSARALIRQLPDTRPGWMMDKIEKKIQVLAPGCEIPASPPPVQDLSFQDAGKGDAEALPLVVWNHRWEYDKGPDTFFRVLERVRDRGGVFGLAVMGEQYGNVPEVFGKARENFAGEIRVWGYQDSRQDYFSWLSRGCCVVSTAIQENFGISVVEAMAHGCLPLLPNRLSYPELIPKAFHDTVIWDSESDLEEKLLEVLACPDRFLVQRKALADHAAGFSWERMARVYDQVLEGVVR